ncbi:MAG: phosphoribosylamine--glycine ligase [Muribaculaceae bacterium]|nr:phosphoribosylamine--glycine ligase [Muribaculaceae bacterium]
MGKSVLVIGSGGREHAIVKSFKKSNRVEKLYCAPGNAGIAADAECVPIKVDDVEALVNFAQRKGIDLTVVGPEASLAAGIVDAMYSAGLKVFGPTKNATRIESSKQFAKELMTKYGIPTATYKSFSDSAEAKEFVRNGKLPAVIKFDGLAAGKGVIIAETYDEAESALDDMLVNKKFGDGNVIIEEFLQGPEFSFMCFVSDDKVYPLELAQDHKRAFDGDKGPNTGGMGAYSPVPFISEETKTRALNEIMIPVAKAMTDENTPFTGVLYGGLILTQEGPKVIEFNARFGDPETEVVLPRLESDIFDFIEAVLEKKDFIPQWSEDAVLGIVLASIGYPDKYEKGAIIKGLEKLDEEVFHMGTLFSDGEFKVNGGRVLMVIARGEDIPEANLHAKEAVACIECPVLFHRSDIGHAITD